MMVLPSNDRYIPDYFLPDEAASLLITLRKDMVLARFASTPLYPIINEISNQQNRHLFLENIHSKCILTGLGSVIFGLECLSYEHTACTILFHFLSFPKFSFYVT